MEDISRPEIAAEILECCRAGKAVPARLLDQILATLTDADPRRAAEAANLVFSRIAEPLADSFEPSDCDSYARLFSVLLGRSLPELDEDEILARYCRIRKLRHCSLEPGDVNTVFVLSRVTLGADVSITSVILDAAKKRFPQAEIVFVGARKGWELFADDHRIGLREVSYPRGGTLADRVRTALGLRDVFEAPRSVVIDPDSRITQLGLVPVCGEANYFFFESRAFGGHGESPLTQLVKTWVAQTFSVVDALPYIAPAPLQVRESPPGITVSLGVGGNQSKRIPGAFEGELLKLLFEFGLPILVDTGAGGEEAERVDSAIAAAGEDRGLISTWSGAFAPFAARVAASRLYVGYDSAGQHVAAASRVPLVSIFAGHDSQRFQNRWAPVGAGQSFVLPVDRMGGKDLLGQIRECVRNLLK